MYAIQLSAGHHPAVHPHQRGGGTIVGTTKARKRCSELLKTMLGIICLGRQAARMILLVF